MTTTIGPRVTPGEWVTFKGGIDGRHGDAMLEGVVNGEPWRWGGEFFVPVHVPSLNANVQVHETNLVTPKAVSDVA